MTSEEYRNKISNFIANHRLASTLERLKNTNDLDLLLTSLKDNDFHKNATIEQLYNFKTEVLKIMTSFNGFIDTVKENKYFFIGEFSDKKIEFEELGIGTNLFECTTEFTDPSSELPILIGTIIEVQELSYANAGNMVTAIYKTLNTNSDRRKIIEVFENGKKATLLTLKILEDNFRALY